MIGDRSARNGAASALAAALLFGLSPPVAKLLLADSDPLVLAALLYLGGGIALCGPDLVAGDGRKREARLRTGDLWLLAAIVAFGGILGPLLMLWGLARISGVLASLLLNLEAPFTVLLGVLFFGDYLGRSAGVASLLVFSGVALLSGFPSEGSADVLGVVAIAGACVSWALDNNLTQRLSLRDPVAVARAKALAAGGCMLAMAVARGNVVPRLTVIAPALLLGFVSYGASLVLAVRAMRLLGAARQALFFATAPFVAAILSIPLLGERPGLETVAAGILMAAGLFVLLSERHAHPHVHKEIEHDHFHVHDEHHQHRHDGFGRLDEPHSHPHRHAPLPHSHAHVPDLHHRHGH